MNYDKYIGIPYVVNGRDYSGIDCWGLVCLYYRDELSIELPSYQDAYENPAETRVEKAISLYKGNWNSTTTPDVGDVVLFNIYGEPRHIGIYIGNNMFLHSRDNKDSVIESLASPRWASRIEGIYKYAHTNSIQVVGAPHPLKTQVIREWTVAGTTVQDFVNYTKEKYNVSPAFESQLIIAVDGKPVPQAEWATTVLQRDQILAYKSVPAGDNPLRMIAMFAVIIFAPELVGSFMGVETAAAGEVLTAGQIASNAAITGSWTFRAATLAVQFAGMALVNAIFPVRPPDAANNPGSPGQMNLFTGGGNQGNRFGSIPVVLGRMRATGLLGAIPYVETAPDTNLLNLLIIWGFGPLTIENLCIGSIPIEDYYADNLSQDVPRPVKVYGTGQEDMAAFNKLYGSDIEQISKGVELVNNVQTGSNPWVAVEFVQQSTSVEIALTCPEGMRAVNTKNGNVQSAEANIQVQIGTWNGSTFVYNDTAPYSVGSGSSNAWTTVIQSSYIPASDEFSANQNLYQYTIIGLLPGGGLQSYSGAATDTIGANPSSTLQTLYKSGSYGSLLGTDNTYTYLPTIPNGVVKLYTIRTYGQDGIGGMVITDHRSEIASSGFTVTGLGITTTAATVDVYDTDSHSSSAVSTGGINVAVASGSITTNASDSVTTLPVEEVIYTSRMLSQGNGTFSNTSSHSPWGDLLNSYGIWNNSAGSNPWETSIPLSASYFKYSGWYTVEASADDEGIIAIDGIIVVSMPYGGGGGSSKNWVYLEKGTHTVRVRGLNSGTGTGDDLKGLAFVITYVPGGLNPQASTYTRFDFGINGFYEKRKDPFNFSYRFSQLPLGRYAIRAKRINAGTQEITEGDITVHYYYKVIFSSAACFNNTNPVVDPPGCALAKTAIRVQSTNKANGQIDGVNAILQTRGKNWNKTSQKWDLEVPINNPASLFLYVLTHPANAYRLTPAEAGVNASGIGVGTKINWAKLQEWHEFCENGNPSGKPLTYNSIVTSTISIMDILRDICACGMASPQYSDGKWTVVIDKPRSYTSQYFTVYNSWGFEATKTLPRVPHAFRITIPDQSIAYQANEFYVYNYGYNADGTGGKTKATLFESLQLPGVTSQEQATFMARWHLAQLVLRPETYTLNTDFEYLVCQRGDVVKVTHDVPQWGVGAGRLKNPQVGSTTLNLTEPLYLTAGKNYQILIRTNSQSNTEGVTKNIDTISATGYYDTVTITSAVIAGDGLSDDNLFMFGEVNKVTQQLVVLSIEPSTNTSAKLTLVDYSPQIYTTDLTQLPIYNANITPISPFVVQNTIISAPVITSIISNSPLSQEITNGIYRNVAIISFSNPADLTKNAEIIQVQIVESTASIESASLNNLYYINKEQGSIVINDLITGGLYKVRARYANQMGTISGPWSDISFFVNIGKDTNYYTAPTLTMDLDGTLIKAYPGNTVKPSNFKHFEYRIYKDPGSEDFWDLPVVGHTATGAETTLAATYNIFSMTSTNEGVFDISSSLNPKPRISAQGVEYRVACRAVDTSGNYSETSTLGAITVKTIQ